MADGVKGASRRYYAPGRTAAAAETRRAILDAARALFTGSGYSATRVADIAARAGVAVDTVYATVGRKPALLRELIETALSGVDEAVPPREREYVHAIRAAPTAEAKLTTYAAAIMAIQGRLAPIFLALRDAAVSDAACAGLWHEISRRRATNMRELAADLRQTGQVREDLSDDDVADVIWSMNAAEYWTLLVGERGWTAERFRDWLADAWIRLLLDPARLKGLPRNGA